QRITHKFVFRQLLAAQRTLHSFPTRRSSDLRSRQHSQSPRLCSFSRAIPPSGFMRRSQTCIPLNGSKATVHSVLPFPVWMRRSRDRKSTRLNSSHDQISYAVFCLKKKNNTTA